MRSSIFVAALVAGCCIAAPTFAQDARERARAFVDQVAYVPAASDRPLARWNDRICVGAVGLAAAEAQALVDRISARALSVGLRPGEPGCQANIMVIYAPDSDTISHEIVDRRRDLLGQGGYSAGSDALQAFANTPRAIRWWHVSDDGAGGLLDRPGVERSRQSQGRETAQAQSVGTPGAGVEGAGELSGVEAVRVSGSRARYVARNNLSYALVVVDARRVANVPAGAWMDYVALVSLAQIDPTAHPEGYDTILNVFDAPQPTQTGLTAWDNAFLRALYRARDATASRQTGDIARRLAQTGH